jgi:hypothetical protein
MFGFIGLVLPIFAWVTIAFAILDLTNAKFHILEKITKECNEKFDPRTLPPLSASHSPGDRPIPRSKTAFELFFSVAFLLWWIRVTPIRQLALFVALGPVGLADKIPFQFGPVWNTIFAPVILLALLSITQQIVNLVHPNWIKFYAGTRLIINACSLILVYFLSRASGVFVLVPGSADSEKLIQTLHIVNLVLHYSFFFVAFVGVFEGFKQIRRLIRARRSPAMSPAL